MEIPVKIREMASHHFDSKKWDNFPFREGDIVITTSYKSGTTWIQNILLSIEFQGKEIPPEAAHLCPWLDLRIPPLQVLMPGLESVPMDARRQVKTHLRLDALNFSPKAKYVYVGRDLRDQFISLHNHYKNGNAHWYGTLNESPGLVGDPLPTFAEKGYNESTLFDDWISKGWPSLEGETDGYPFWSGFDHINSWWEYRHLPNIKFIHYNDMLEDLGGSIREISAFLGIPIKKEYFNEIVKKNTFDYMKENAELNPLTGFIGGMFEGGAKTFINKGKNGLWKEFLSEDQLKKFDEKVKEKLTPECAAWLEKGKASGIDPSTA